MLETNNLQDKKIKQIEDVLQIARSLLKD